MYKLKNKERPLDVSYDLIADRPYKCNVPKNTRSGFRVLSIIYSALANRLGHHPVGARVLFYRACKKKRGKERRSAAAASAHIKRNLVDPPLTPRGRRG